MHSEQTQLTSSNTVLKSTYFDVADHPLIWRWMLETAKRDPKSFECLTQDNTYFFKNLLGKPQWHQPLKKGSKEWSHRWVCIGQGLTWLIQTGPNGTVFRIRSMSSLEHFKQEPMIGVGAIAYLKELLSLMTGTQT